MTKDSSQHVPEADMPLRGDPTLSTVWLASELMGRSRAPRRVHLDKVEHARRLQRQFSAGCWLRIEQPWDKQLLAELEHSGWRTK